MTDQEQTMGEDAPSESATDDSDWKVVRSRQQRRRQEQFLLNNNAANLTSQQNHQGMKPQRIKGSVIKAGRMPRLPKEHEKVIIRPQGGLNIAQTPTPLLASAILAASGIKREDAKEDILSPNAQQNIVVASSPSTEHTERYKQIKQLVINNKRYDVNTYVSAPDQTSKGVIRGIPLEYDNKTIEMAIVNPRNPLALAARRLGNTTAVIITFDGMKVPRTVFYDLALMPCTLYKKQIDICHQCGRLGHRMDVCPNPTNRICRGCGARNPNQDHQCQPKCNLCGGEHQTADKTRKARFKTPYLVRRRRWESQRADIQPPAQDFPPLLSTTSTGPASRSRSRSKSQTNRSRASSRSRSRTRAATPSEKWDLVCERNHLPSLVFTITSIGSAMGTVFFGALSDRIGRRFAFFITVVIATVFGVSSILVTNFVAFVVLRFMNATIMPQIFQLPYVILLELVGPKQRTAMLAIGWMSWTAGLCLLPLVAFLSRDWIVLGLICSAAAALNAIYWKLLPESPRWLLSRNRFSEATGVLTRIAKTNGVCPPKNLATDLERVQRKLVEEEKVAKSSTVDIIRVSKVRSNFLIITLSWVANASAYYGMSINVTNMSGNEFVNFFLLALVEFPGCVIAWWAMEKLGRRWMNVFFQLMVSASCIGFCLVPKDAQVAGIVLVMLAKLFCTASAMVMYQQASEVMPTPVRSFALGASSSIASTITICMPYIIYLGKYGTWIPFAAIAMLATLGGVFSAWLPETRGYPLYQNMEDAQKFSAKQKFFSFNRRPKDQQPTLDKQTNEKEMNLLSNGCPL